MGLTNLLHSSLIGSGFGFKIVCVTGILHPCLGWLIFCKTITVSSTGNISAKLMTINSNKNIYPGISHGYENTAFMSDMTNNCF